MPAPNVLVLMSDQHRADMMGCAGDPVVRVDAPYGREHAYEVVNAALADYADEFGQ